MGENGQNGRPRRRSTRILLRLPLLINALRASEEPAWERVETVTISKHGAMVRTRENYQVGDALEIHMREKGRSAHAKVVWTSSQVTPQGIELGFEIQDDDEFWEVNFPPDRWSGRDKAAEEKP
jgi:hypothetical protein